VRCLLTLLFLSCFAHAQTVERNQISLSGGWTQQVFVNTYDGHAAPTVGLSYGYRPWKFLEFETGISVGLQPGPQLCSRFGCYDPNDRYIWIPVGLRLIALLVAKRVELSLGGGGLIQKYWVSNPTTEFGVSSQAGFGGYFSAGAAVAVDRRRRFWFGLPSVCSSLTQSFAAGAGSPSLGTLVFASELFSTLWRSERAGSPSPR
jgi:hypothetical protein